MAKGSIKTSNDDFNEINQRDLMGSDGYIVGQIYLSNIETEVLLTLPSFCDTLSRVSYLKMVNYTTLYMWTRKMITMRRIGSEKSST